jgi:hypothetical protein
MHRRTNSSAHPNHFVAPRRQEGGELLTASVDSEKGSQTALRTVTSTGGARSLGGTTQLDTEAIEPFDTERHLLGDLGPEPGRQALVFGTAEQLLQVGGRRHHCFDLPCRGGVLAASRAAPRGREGRPGGGGESSKATGAHLEAKGGGKDVLELVRLVNDKGVVLGKHLSSGAKVGTEKVKVDNDDVGSRGFGPGSLSEALATRRAAA